ncbi:PAS domain S-box protein [Falsiroseomonas selenitidurans]|uniref:histidine kinase n=1 Tax=Falsiroseomonas selenitidurans TaxID=2716335 RepID=A0ABX1E6U8_9PROT|nr:PAS domain S-box protein [Falsiroseomonas selenitidurans]NKC32911.1 PAS domain S-box protein [Falsiroseomonas selenitidurans]
MAQGLGEGGTAGKPGFATLIETTDWAATPLGPRAGWPQALRTILRLMQHSGQPMFLAWGKELSFLYNDAYVPILGARHPAALGQPFRAVWSEVWEELLPLVQRALQGTSTWMENLHLVLHRNGYPEDNWYTFSYSPVHDDAGAIAGMFCTCMETTGQVLAERRLRENEGRFRALLDAAPAMMRVTDRDGHCTHLNRSWYAFTGQDEATGLGLGWLEAVHPEDRPRAKAQFARAVAARESLRVDYRLRHVDGSWRWAIDAAEPRIDPEGRYLGHVGSVMDITDRREAEERQTLLAREVDHRAKNVLAVVQAALRLTRATDIGSFTRTLEGRVAALARAQTLLAKDSWVGADLETMLRGELAAFLGEEPALQARAWLEGPAIALPAEATQPLTMLVHELATNAVKHGALSVEAGHLAVRWWLSDQRLVLTWTESGGPPLAAPPSRVGFGTRVLDATARRQLGGTIALDWRPEGLACRLGIPLRRKPPAPDATDSATLTIL